MYDINPINVENSVIPYNKPLFACNALLYKYYSLLIDSYILIIHYFISHHFTPHSSISTQKKNQKNLSVYE